MDESNAALSPYQLYLLELFLDKITIYIDEDTKTNTNKKLFVRSMFGPKHQFIFKESQLAYVDRKDEIAPIKRESVDDGNTGGSNLKITDSRSGTPKGQKGWSRTFRVGFSFLFPKDEGKLEIVLEDYPLDFHVWSGEEDENPELLGVGNMHWHTLFFPHLRENVHRCDPHPALSIKEIVPIFNECCCTKIGELFFVVRLSPLGKSINCEFQQLLDKDPDKFIFRTDKCPSLFECKRIEPGDKAYNTKDSLYEVALREDPDVIQKLRKRLEVCTELESCGVAKEGLTFACQHEEGKPKDLSQFKIPKPYPINKIRMGDIVGPCGNANCLLAHKMRTFIRNQYAYKKETIGQTFGVKAKSTHRVCGQCGCNNDIFHSEKVLQPEKKTPCAGCGGLAQAGQTCDERLNRLFGTGMTPLSSKTNLKNDYTSK